MNGLNSLGGATGGTGSASVGPAASDAAGFNEAFQDQAVTTAAVLMQFIGADILESVMKDEQAVD